MRSFAFHRPTTLYEMSALLGGVDDSMPLAGGMTLLPTIKQRLAAPAALIDLSKIPQLSGISAQGGVLTVGAMTRHVDVAEFGTGSQPDTAACRPRSRHRRSRGSQPRHDRWFGRQ